MIENYLINLPIIYNQCQPIKEDITLKNQDPPYLTPCSTPNKIINKLHPEIFLLIIPFIFESKKSFFNFQLVCKFFLDIADSHLEKIFKTKYSSKNIEYKNEGNINIEYKNGRDINILLTNKVYKRGIHDIITSNYLNFLIYRIFSGHIIRGRPYYAIELFLNYSKEPDLKKRLSYLDRVEIFYGNNSSSEIACSSSNFLINLQDQKNASEDHANFIYHKAIDYLTQKPDPKLYKFLKTPATALNMVSNIRSTSESEIIIAACQKDDEEMVRLMIQSRMIIGSRYPRGKSITHWAVENANLKYLRIFIDENIDINRKNHYGNTPLIFCLIKEQKHAGDFTVAHTLMKAGANIHEVDYSKNTALSLASKFNRLDFVKILIEYGAKKQHQNSLLETPQHLAAKHGSTDIIKFFWADREINFEIKDQLGNSVFHTAVVEGKKDIVNILAKPGINIESKNNAGRSPLNSAAHHDHPEILEILVALQADIESTDHKKWRPLHYAAREGNMASINTLIAAQASIDPKNNEKNTPLIIAALNNQTEAVERLIHLSQFDPVANQEDRIKLFQLKNDCRPEIIDIIKNHLHEKYSDKFTVDYLFLKISCAIL